MNLINEEVTHKVFGEGNIVDHDESVITIDFNEDIKNLFTLMLLENLLH